MASQVLAPIVCAVDERYLVGVCALMRSLGAHYRGEEPLRLIVLADGLTVAGSALLTDVGRSSRLAVEVRRVEESLVRRGWASGWVSDAVYLRLVIPDVIADEPRVLYLDADVLVLGDVTPLLKHPLGGAPMAAVRDCQNPTVGRGWALPNCAALGVPTGRAYFNSGVMLLDLEVCRRERVFEAAQQFLTDHPAEVRFWDQDALNVAAGDRWTRLDRRWNTVALSPLAGRPGFVHHAEPVMPLADLLCDEYEAVILHFAGPDKPWSPDYPAGPLRDLYRRYCDAGALAGAR